MRVSLDSESRHPGRSAFDRGGAADACLYDSSGICVPDASVALDTLLRWARMSGRGFDETRPLVLARFTPAEVVAYMDAVAPGTDSLRTVFESL